LKSKKVPFRYIYHFTAIQLTSLPALSLSETEAASEEQLEKIKKLEQILFELQGEIGAGNHVPPGVRVLALKQNPAQEWSDLRQAVMDRLKGENEALIKRLKELEEGGYRAGEVLEMT